LRKTTLARTILLYGVRISTHVLFESIMNMIKLVKLYVLIFVTYFATTIQISADEIETAHFIVTKEVSTPDVKPFTATIGFGNGGKLTGPNSGFEPVIYSTRYIASNGTAHKVFVDKSAISQYNTLKTGALDGANVDIYRIADGSFTHVRADTIPEGGFQISGWFPVLKKNMVIDPHETQYTFSWDPWNRPEVPYYFSVRSIDKWGNISDYATPITSIKPKTIHKATNSNNIIKFKPSINISLFKNPQAPQNLTGTITKNGTLKLSWDQPDSTVAGYLIYKSDVLPRKHKGFYFELTNNGPAIKTGDMVMLHKKFYSSSRIKTHSNRVWGAGKETRFTRHNLVSFFSDEDPNRHWELLPHTTNTPVSQPGETFLRVTLRNNKKFSLSWYNHSGTGQHWYPVLIPGKKYQFEVWLRGDHAQQVVFGLAGFYGQKNINNIKPIKFNITKEWKKYSTTFTPRTLFTGGKPQPMYLKLFGPAKIDVDNFRVYSADTPYLKYSDEKIAKLKASGMRALRMHGLIATKNTSYDLEQLTNSEGITSSNRVRNTLPDYLNLTQSVGMQPWLQIEPHLSPEEWLGFVEYLAADYDPMVDTPNTKSWAWKRVKQGQQEPWTSEFDEIYLEIGNETWNRLFRPWTFSPMTDAETGQKYSAGAVYGLYQEYILSTMRSSTYWNALKPHLKTIIGGWANINAYGRDAAHASPSSDFLTIAAYNGGWDENEGPVRPTPVSFFNVLNQVSQSALPTAKKIKNDAREVQKNRTRPLALGTYESGPGYALNGLNRAKVTEEQAAEQEVVMKSLAAGTATLDAFLARASEGFTLQSYFTFGTGRYWKSHARPVNGGQAYPAWDLLTLFNQKGTGDLLRVEATQVPTTSLKAYRRREAVEDAPLVAVYATQKKDRLTLILISRRVPNYPSAGDSGATTVTVELPFTTAKKITKYSMTGTYASHNVFSKQVRIIPKVVTDQVTLPLFKIPELPPGQTVMFAFDGIEN